MKITKLFILLFTVFFTGIMAISATSGLNVVLANQNPDPVSPGNYVYVNVIVSNLNDEDINDAQIRFKPNEYFKLAPGMDNLKQIGVIPKNSGASSGASSYYIAKYKVAVSNNIPLGLNPIDFDVIAEGKTFSYNFDVLVQDSNPTIQVKEFSVDQIEAGKQQKATLNLLNQNSVDLKDIEVKLNLDKVDSQILSTPSGSNSFRISNLASQEEKSMEFDLAVNPQAQARNYLLPITISYKDALGNFYTQDLMGSVRVNSESKVELVLDSQNIYTSGNIRTVFAIANPGTSAVKGTQVNILPGDNYEVLEGKNQYIGNLNPDDFQTIQSQIFVKEQKETTINVELTYSDSYNNLNSENVEIPLRIYSNEELQSFGLSGSGESSFGFGTIVQLLIVGLIAFFVGRKFGFKKARKLKK